MTQFEHENDLDHDGGEVDDETLEALGRSVADTPNRSAQDARPTEPQVPGPGSVDTAQ